MPFSFNNMLASVAAIFNRASKKPQLGFALESDEILSSSSATYFCDAEPIKYKAINIYAALDEAAAAGSGEVVLWQATHVGFGCTDKDLFNESVIDLDTEIAAGGCNMTAVPADLSMVKTSATRGFAGSSKIVFNDEYTKIFCGYAVVLASMNGNLTAEKVSCLTTALSAGMEEWNDSVAKADCTNWTLLGIYFGIMGTLLGAAVCAIVYRRPSGIQAAQAAGFFSPQASEREILLPASDSDRFEDVTDKVTDETAQATIKPLEISEGSTSSLAP